MASRPSAGKVRLHREKLRKRGLRPLQIWVTDTRSPRFALEARRQAQAIAASDSALDDQAFIDAISDPA